MFECPEVLCCVISLFLDVIWVLDVCRIEVRIFLDSSCWVLKELSVGVYPFVVAMVLGASRCMLVCGCRQWCQ